MSKYKMIYEEAPCTFIRRVGINKEAFKIISR